MQYLAELYRWNSAYNLSAVRDAREMLYKHLLDSLSIAPLLYNHPGVNILDVGTGAGLPGMPLAICFPERRFTLLDSAGKKTRFLVQISHQMGLRNIRVNNTRVEKFRGDKFDIVMSRAFASVGDMVSLCSHLVAVEGQFWALKGVFPETELSALKKNYKVDACLSLQVPGNIGERCLVIIKTQTTPENDIERDKTEIAD